jgi:O-antigen ligase
MENLIKKIQLIPITSFFYLAIFALPLYLFRFNFLGLPMNIFEIFAILAITALIFKKKSVFGKSLRDVPFLVFVGSMLLLAGLLFSIFLNNNHLSGAGILKSWFLLPIIFAFGLFLVLNSKEIFEKVFLSFYLSAISVGFIAIIYKLNGIVTYDNRLKCFYASPNYLAMYLTPAIFLGFYFLLRKYREKNISGQFFLHFFLIVFLLLLPLYYTYSYGAWLSLTITLATTLIILTPQKKWLFLFPVIVLTVFLVFQTNSSKFLSLIEFSERSSFASRIMIWKASFLMIRQHPLVGIGPGNFQTAYLSLQKYFPPYLEWAVPQPHNIFLAFWLQSGIIGLLGFLCLLFFSLRLLLNILKNDQKNANLAAPLFAFFIYVILHGLIDTPYWKNDLAVIFWIFMATTISLEKLFYLKNKN